LRHELDWIVMKCLEKDRARRYQTASNLARDIESYLHDEPVQACRPSAWYQMRKFARRNRAALAATGLVVALLLGIAAGSIIAMGRYREVAQRATEANLVADAARRRADTHAQEATRARNESDANAARANAARAEADQSAAESQAVVGFVVDDVLVAAAPSKTRGKAVTVLEALANADRSIEGKFAHEPRVEASVRHALAQVYTELGEYEKAERHAARALALREKALGAEHEATLRPMNTLGWTYALLGKRDKYEQGEALYRRMLEICRRTRGEEAELTLDAMSGLGAILGRLAKNDESATLAQRNLEIVRKTKGPAAPDTLTAMNNLAISFQSLGKLKEAEPLLREVVQADIKSRPDHPGTLIQMNNYVWLLLQLGRKEEAGDWAMRSMEAHLRVLKLKHPNTRAAIHLAVDTQAASHVREAVGIAERVLEQARSEFGPDDPKTLEFLTLRVAALFHMGDLEEAGAGAEGLVEIRTRTLGPDAPDTLTALSGLALIRRRQGATGEARTLLARLRDALRRALDSGRKKGIDAGEAFNLCQRIAWAEVIGRNLDRPERSDAAPGTPGGPPRIDAPYRVRSPVADERIDPGEYGDRDGFAFDFTDDRNPGRLQIFDEKIPTTKSPSDLSCRLRAAHTATALFLAFRVRDQSVHADPASAHAPWLNDCMEVFIDGDRTPNDFRTTAPGCPWWLGVDGSPEGFQILADALGNRSSCNLRPIGVIPFKVGTSRTEDGYIIELEIALSQIDTQDGPVFRAAATGSELRMNVGINDVDEAVTSMTCFGILWAEDSLTKPTFGGEDYWPVALRLVPARKPSP
jgi:tetratricopeptide (TPR) repeat protein